MSAFFGYDTEKDFEYENGFYLTSQPSRIAKLVTHYELYRMIADLPGQVIECGVFRGASLIRLATFRDMLENPASRRVIGFDTFGDFPQTDYLPDRKRRQLFLDETGGGGSIPVEDLRGFLAHKGLGNVELVPGDLTLTAPEYLLKHPELKIAFLHIDTDIYEPAKAALDVFGPRMVRGGVIVFDDYGTFPGETKAADDFLAASGLKINKLRLSHHIPSYVVMP